MPQTTSPSDLENLLRSLRDGEGTTVEAKASASRLSQDIWETLSAFANTLGGTIVLGVAETESGEFEPVGVANPHEQVTAFFNQQNNRQKFSAEVCTPDDVYVLTDEGRSFVIIQVPMADRRRRPVFVGRDPLRGTFKRRHGGDYRCTEEEVRIMLREGATHFPDKTLLEDFTLDDLDLDALRTYRRRFQNENPGSPFNDEEDRGFLIELGGYEVDRKSKREGLTVAGLLLFGRRRAIREWRGRHLIDFRFRENPEQDRWDHRVTWESHLYGAYFAIYPELVRGLKVPFEMRPDGTRPQQPPEAEALQEALVNLLAHADYQETDASVILREPDGYHFTNPGNSRIRDLLTAQRKKSDPRNPTVLAAFRQIGLADEAGSGIKKIRKTWRRLGLSNPVIDVGIDDYAFDLRLRNAHILSDRERTWISRLLDTSAPEEQKLALIEALRHGRIDNAELSRRSGCHAADATKALTGLRDRGHLVKEGERRGAWYHLSNSAQVTWDGLSSLDSAPSPPHRVSDSVASSPHNEAEVSYSEGEVPHREGGVSGSGRKKLSNPAEQPSDFPHGRKAWNSMRAVAASVREVKRARSAGTVQDTVRRILSIADVSLAELSLLTGRTPGYLANVLSQLTTEGKARTLYPKRHPQQR